MRAVLDANVVISGLLWLGPPRRILDLARQRRLQLFTSLPLLSELDAVLRRPKFVQRLATVGLDPDTLVVGYASLAVALQFVPPLPQRVCRDPTDDDVLACANAAGAEIIISGDNDLAALRQFNGIPIRNAVNALALIQRSAP